MKKTLLGLLLLTCFTQTTNAYAWQLRPQNALTASQDVLAVSSDTRNVGTSNIRWKNGYYSFIRMAHKDLASDHDFVDTASYGTVYVSLDTNLYYRTASGNVTKLN